MIPSLGPRRGGPSFMLPRLVRELSRQGVEVTLLTTDDNGRERLVDSERQVPVVGGPVYSYLPRTTRFYTYSRTLGRWLKSHTSEFDLAHIHAVFSYPSVAACFRARQRRVPFIVRPLGVLNRWGLEHRRPWMKHLSLAFIERPLLNRSHAIHCTSEAEAREVEFAGIRAPRVIIPNPVKVPTSELPALRGNWRRRLPGVADRKWLLFLSRIDPKKGLESTFEALAALPARSRPVLLLAGSGDPDYEKSLIRLQNRLGLEGDVTWLGFLQNSEKWAAFADSDAFVLNSHSENFGIAAAEAMGSGLPVLVSEQVGLAQQVLEHDTGIVTPSETTALATNIPRILAPESRQKGKRGKAFVEKELSFESVASRVLQLYHRALQQ